MRVKKILLFLLFPIALIGQTKITELPVATSIDSADVIPFVDVSADTTKKITMWTLQNNIDLAYGNWSDTTDQTFASATVAYPITFNCTDDSWNITKTGDSLFTISIAGVYLITWSAVGKSAAVNKTLEIWIRVDNVDVPRSNTVSRFVGTANERIITVTYIYKFTAGQQLKLMRQSNDTGTTLEYTTSGTNPTRPISPSIILTINKISN